MKDFAKAGINQYRIRTGPIGSDDSIGNHGAFVIPRDHSTRLFIVASDGDECGWEHVSVHVKYETSRREIKMRTPTWEEMCFVKNLFFDLEDAVMQLHPPESEWIDNHPHCLHLWRPEFAEIPRPDSILVGI